MHLEVLSQCRVEGVVLGWPCGVKDTVVTASPSFFPFTYILLFIGSLAALPRFAGAANG